MRAVKLAVAIEQTLPLHGGRAYCLWRQIPDPTLAWAVRSAPPPLCGRLHWQTDPDPTLAGEGGRRWRWRQIQDPTLAGGGGLLAVAVKQTLPLQGGAAGDWRCIIYIYIYMYITVYGTNRNGKPQ